MTIKSKGTYIQIPNGHSGPTRSPRWLKDWTCHVWSLQYSIPLLIETVRIGERQPVVTSHLRSVPRLCAPPRPGLARPSERYKPRRTRVPLTAKTQINLGYINHYAPEGLSITLRP